MTDRENFDQAMKTVLGVSRAEMQKRIAADNQRTRVGEKRGPKPKSLADVSRGPVADGQR